MAPTEVRPTGSRPLVQPGKLGEPGCTKLLTDASLTFQLDASGKIELDENGKPTVVLTPENRETAEVMSNSIQMVVKDSARVSVQSAIDEFSAAFADPGDDNRCTGMVYVVFRALLEHQTKAAESRRHKFMNERAVEGADPRAHIQRMRELKRLWWDKLSKPEQTAASSDLATGMLNSLAPTLQSLVRAATLGEERTFDRIIAVAKKAIEDTESKAAGDGPRRPLFAGSVEQPADPPNAWEQLSQPGVG